MTKHGRYRRLDPIDSIHSLDRSIPPGNLVDRRRSTPPGGHDRLNRIVYQPERAWVAGRLRFIGEELGMHCALITTQQHLYLPSMCISHDNLAVTPRTDAYDFFKMVSRLQEAHIPPSPHLFRPVSEGVEGL